MTDPRCGCPATLAVPNRRSRRAGHRPTLDTDHRPGCWAAPPDTTLTQTRIVARAGRRAPRIGPSSTVVRGWRST